MNATVGAAFDVQSVRLAIREVEAKIIEAKVFPASGDFPDTFPEVGRRLRMRRRGEADPVATASLILNEEGALLWHAGQPPTASTGRGLRRGVPEAPAGELVELFQYEPLEPNEILQHLVDLDARLNENLDTTRNAAPRLVPLTFNAGPASSPQGFTINRGQHFQPAGSKKRLLFVHGTFSKTEAFFEGIRKAPAGPAFLKKLSDNYA